MKRFLFFLLLLPLLLTAAEKVVFSESFESADSLKKWREIPVKDGATFSVRDKSLDVSHGFVTGGAGFVEIEVPRIKKGRLDFDMMIETPRGGDGIGLILELYNIATFWHDARSEWRLYFPEPNANRLPFFDIEPVGHHKAATVRKNKFQHYRIVFDEDQDLVEFYVDDMNDPVAARYDVSVFGHAFYRGGLLRIGSFGYAPTRYSSRVKNVVLTEITGNAEKTADSKNNILLFEGMSTLKYKAAQNIPMKKGDILRTYAWEDSRMHLDDRNAYIYSKTPSYATIENAKYIVFSDAANVDPAIQKKIVQSVRNGTKVFFLGGFFSLAKGNYHNTVLGNHLPVILDTPFNMKGDLKKPIRMKLDGTEGDLYLYQEFKPKEDAEVLYSVDGIPLIIRKQIGKGSITVFTGTPAGPSGKTSFWNTGILKKIFELGLK